MKDVLQYEGKRVIVTGAAPADLLLRARAAAAAGRRALAIATLEDVAGMLQGAPALRPLAREALGILDTLAPAASHGDRTAEARARLEQLLP